MFYRRNQQLLSGDTFEKEVPSLGMIGLSGTVFAGMFDAYRIILNVHVYISALPKKFFGFQCVHLPCRIQHRPDNALDTTRGRYIDRAHWRWGEKITAAIPRTRLTAGHIIEKGFCLV